MITNIRLQQFRSYQDASFEFDAGVNVIVGPNASGKTNLLEAVLLVARGKSYRAKDNELVAYQKPWARIDADIVNDHRVVKLERQQDHVQKTFTIDEKHISRLSITKQIPAVLFEPNDLLMLSSSPELRRGFLDNLIEQTDIQYGKTLAQYKRTLLQRNRLLKVGDQSSLRQLFVWDIRMSELAAQIVTARLAMLERINQSLTAIYSELAQDPTELVVEYSTKLSTANYASSLLKKLEKDQQLDVARGFTGGGPHREDIIFSLNQQPLIATASRGEIRTTLLSLKIIELRIIKTLRDQKPILLLDDVFSELDGARRKALTEFMQDYQTFITTTDADIIAHDFAQSVQVIALTGA